MGRSYLNSRDNISTGQIILFCSYGEMCNGKVSRCDVHFVTGKQKVFPLNGKVVFIWDKNYLGHGDLACQLACVAGGIREHKGRSLKYRLPKN